MWQLVEITSFHGCSIAFETWYLLLLVCICFYYNASAIVEKKNKTLAALK